MKSSNLKGLFVHILKDGLAQNQGEVISTDGDLAEVQLFSAATGAPTTSRIFPESLLRSSECRLYRDADSWRKDFLSDGRAWIQRSREHSAAVGGAS